MLVTKSPHRQGRFVVFSSGDNRSRFVDPGQLPAFLTTFDAGPEHPSGHDTYTIQASHFVLEFRGADLFKQALNALGQIHVIQVTS